MLPEDSPNFHERNKAWTSKNGFYCKLCSSITCKKEDFHDFKKWINSDDASKDDYVLAGPSALKGIKPSMINVNGTPLESGKVLFFDPESEMPTNIDEPEAGAKRNTGKRRKLNDSTPGAVIAGMNDDRKLLLKDPFLLMSVSKQGAPLLYRSQEQMMKQHIIDYHLSPVDAAEHERLKNAAMVALAE